MSLALALLPVVGQSAEPLARARLDVESLSAWKTRVYDFKSEREPAFTGRLSLTTRIEEGGVYLEDEWNLPGPGRVLTKVQCRADNYLSPVRAEITVVANKLSVADLQPQATVIKFEDDRATIEWDGKTTVTKGRFLEALTNSALYRVVTLLPVKKATAFSFARFEGGNFQAEHRIECLGEDVVMIDGRSFRAVKFAHTGKNISPQYFWVREGQLLQVLTDESKWLQLKVNEPRARTLGKIKSVQFTFFPISLPDPY